MDERILEAVEGASQCDANFARKMDRDLRPVIQNAKITSPNAPASTVFISGIPYAVDIFRQFLTPVYAIFDRFERRLAFSGQDARVGKIVTDVVAANRVLGAYVRERLRSAGEIAFPGKDEPDHGMNLAIFNANGGLCATHELEGVENSYQPKILAAHSILYDHPVYPLIFWDGHGGCGSEDDLHLKGASIIMRKTLISLVLQGRGHFIHKLGSLREALICSVPGRLFNLTIKYLAGAEKDFFAREDEVRQDADEGKEYGLRTFVPASLTDSNKYWMEVATKCFAISAQLGPPPSFSLSL
jgi:hypothetical protein